MGADLATRALEGAVPKRVNACATHRSNSSEYPSPHPRWANVRVSAGHDGVLVERDTDPSAALHDLRLVERLTSAADNSI
jgi:hypothetical protein